MGSRMFPFQGCLFIRCIKANNRREPGVFDRRLVYRQLRDRYEPHYISGSRS